MILFDQEKRLSSYETFISSSIHFKNVSVPISLQNGLVGHTNLFFHMFLSLSLVLTASLVLFTVY